MRRRAVIAAAALTVLCQESYSRAQAPGRRGVETVTSGQLRANGFHVRDDLWITVLHVLRTGRPAYVGTSPLTTRCTTVAVDPEYDLAALWCPGTHEVPQFSIYDRDPTPFASLELLTATGRDRTRIRARPIQSLVRLARGTHRECRIGKRAFISRSVPIDGESGSPLVIEVPGGQPRVVGMWSGRYEPPGKRRSARHASGRRGIIAPYDRILALVGRVPRSNPKPLRIIPRPHFYRCATGRIDPRPLAQVSAATACFSRRMDNGSAAAGCPAVDDALIEDARSLREAAELLHRGRTGMLSTVVIADSVFRSWQSTGQLVAAYDPEVAAFWRKHLQGQGPWGAIEANVLERGVEVVMPLLASDPALRRRAARMMDMSLMELLRNPPSPRDVFQKVTMRRDGAPRTISGTDRLSLCTVIAGAAKVGTTRAGSPEAAWRECFRTPHTNWHDIARRAHQRLKDARCLPRGIPPNQARVTWHHSGSSPRFQIALWLEIASVNGFDIGDQFAAYRQSQVGDALGGAAPIQALAHYVDLVDARFGNDRAVASELHALRTLVPPAFDGLGQTVGGFLAHNLCRIPETQSPDGLTLSYLRALEGLQAPVCRQLERLNVRLAHAGVIPDPPPIWCDPSRRRPASRTQPVPVAPSRPIVQDAAVAREESEATRNIRVLPDLSAVIRAGARRQPVARIRLTHDLVMRLEDTSEIWTSYFTTGAAGVTLGRPKNHVNVFAPLDLRPGDRVVEIDSQAVTAANATHLLRAARARGAATIKVERFGSTRTIEYYVE